MTYEPTNWKAGDVVTSAKLNKMEQGIAGHDVIECIMESNSSVITLNKTWQEIWDNNYTHIALIYGSSVKTFVSIIGLQIDNGTYSVGAVGPGNSQITFICNSSDDYPSYTEPSSGEDANDGGK